MTLPLHFVVQFCVIVPLLQDDAFLADVETKTEQEPGALHLWWLGQSGYLVAWNGLRIVFDPYLSDSLTKKYATSDKPHVRMTARVVAPERLTGVSLITASHQHTDHLDSETLVALLRSNPGAVLILPKAHLPLAQERVGARFASRLAPLNPGDEAIVHAKLRVTAVPAAHERPETDENGNALYLGFLIELGPWRLYHSGDTVRYPGMESDLRGFGIDIAFLPINGNRPERRVSGNLWGDEAAQLAFDIGAKTVIPCHYELFSFNTEPPDLFVQTCEQLGQPYHILQAGERLTLTR